MRILILLFVVWVVCDGIKINEVFRHQLTNRNQEKIDHFFHHQLFKRDLSIPSLAESNTNFVIPNNSNIIKVGYAVTNTPGYYNLLYNQLAYQGIQTAEYIINSNGGVIINNTLYYVQIIAYNAGPDCENFLITYQYLILNDNISFIITPVNPGCPELVILANLYNIPVLNPADFTLDYLTRNDETFKNLNVYSVTPDIISLGISCLQPLVEKNAKTYAIFYEPSIGNDTIAIIKAGANVLGMIEIVNTTLLYPDIQSQITNGNNCSYVDPYIEMYVKNDPDVLIGSFGPSYTDLFIFCMHKQKYHPRALWLITGSAFTGHELWQTAGSLYSDFWVKDGNFTDPYLKSVNYYFDTYSQMWGTTNIAQISYAATFSVSLSILFSAMSLANSVDPKLTSLEFQNLNFLSIIGNIYLLNDTHNFHHPIYCSQRLNDTNPFGPVVYPSDTPGAVTSVYPYPFEFDTGFLSYLKTLNKRGISKSQLIGIIVGSIVGFILISAPIALILWAKFKWHLILIPKETDKNGEW